MKKLLRSCFKDQPTEDSLLLLRNYQALRDSDLGFDIQEDDSIWNFIKDFASQYQHVPDSSTVRSHFLNVNQLSVADRVDALCLEPCITQGDFIKHLEARAEDRRNRIVAELFREAARIMDTGMTIKEGRKETHLRGAQHAIRHVLERSQEVIAPTLSTKLSGDITTDGSSFRKDYERVESDPLAGVGQFTGIRQMDETLKGAKRSELWTHAAFTGGLKSTLSMNWHYNQAIYYKHSSVLFSLEMPYKQVRNIIVSMHTGHEKFQKVRAKLGIKKSLEYEKIRDGELSKEEKEFLFDYVITDLEDDSNNYGHIHIEVADPDKSDFTVADLRSKAELLYTKDPGIKMITVDHAGLMQSRGRHSGTTERLNEVLRDLKRLAMSFNRGMGIAVIALFQISREGYKSAEKGGGRYNLTHLSYANEAERSSDIVTAGWVDTELRESNLVKFQCLKSRDQAPFKDFYSGVLWQNRRIYTTTDVTVAAAKKTGDEIDLNLD